MNDPIAYGAGVAQGSADAIARVSSPTPAAYEGNADYADGYAEGLAHASGPVSTPEPTDPNEIYGAGIAHGAADRANQSSSPMSPELENRKEYQEGETLGTDPAAYAAGEQAGRADTAQKRSSATPSEYEGNPAYAQGYADGAAAPPYLADVEAQTKAEADERERIAEEERKRFAESFARQQGLNVTEPLLPNSPGQQTEGPFTGSGPGVPEPPEWPDYHEPPERYVPEVVD